MEEHHPQIQFDWPQILNGEEEAAPEPAMSPRRSEPSERPAPPPPPRPVSMPVPVGSTVPPGDAPISPAHARLGSEGLARLRARHADVVASIDRRTQDEQRRRDLYEHADRLNPDTWVTDGEVTRGLEEYESILAALRDVVGRRRRRKRSRPPGQPGAEGAPPADGADDPGGPDAEGDAEDQ
jgi:hypothetical protein